MWQIKVDIIGFSVVSLVGIFYAIKFFKGEVIFAVYWIGVVTGICLGLLGWAIVRYIEYKQKTK